MNAFEALSLCIPWPLLRIPSRNDTLSVVATVVTNVGGKNNNHGGAVSLVARGSHGGSQDGPHPAPETARR
jgi:hypothetical protein